MYYLPELYVQRAERVFKSSKPKHDFCQRNYLVSLVDNLLEGAFLPILSGIDTFIPMAPLVSNCVAYLDYGYNIEIVKRFSSSIFKVDFDKHGYPSAALASVKRKKALIIIDLLGEVATPEFLLAGIKESISKDDLFFIICPERDSQKNDSVLGPPTVNFRAREWNSSEIEMLVKDSLGCSELSCRVVSQNLNNKRKDVIVSNCSKEFMNKIEELDISSKIKSKFDPELNSESSDFNFCIPRFGRDDVPKAGLCSYYSPDEITEVLINSLACKKPFSLIRVGHAEVRTMGFPDFVHPVWASRSLNVCFGNGRVSSIYNKLFDEMIESFDKSDALGVPSMVEEDQHWKNAIPLLQHYGCCIDTKFLLTQNIHLQMLELGYYERIISQASKVLIVGCRDLRTKFENKFGVEASFLKIPGEAKFVEEERSHYPDSYEAIKEDIRQNIAPLVLVGAGLPGNVYCNVAKEAGAVSIDIGSVMDIWAGENTRTNFGKYQKYVLK